MLFTSETDLRLFSFEITPYERVFIAIQLVHPTLKIFHSALSLIGWYHAVTLPTTMRGSAFRFTKERARLNLKFSMNRTNNSDISISPFIFRKRKVIERIFRLSFFKKNIMGRQTRFLPFFFLLLVFSQSLLLLVFSILSKTFLCAQRTTTD